MLKSDNARYESEHQRKLLFTGVFFLTFSLFAVIDHIKTNKIDMRTSMFFSTFIAIGLINIMDTLHRKKEIEKLISGRKYLIGHMDSVEKPNVIHMRGFKSGLFSYIDETGKRYCVQSEPFNLGKIPFDKETAVKIYADSLTLPKITYVSAENYYDGETAAENDTDGTSSDE